MQDTARGHKEAVTASAVSVPREKLGSVRGRRLLSACLQRDLLQASWGRRARRDHQSLARLLSADPEESRWREGALWLWAPKLMAGLPSLFPSLATVSLFVKWGSLLVISRGESEDQMSLRKSFGSPKACDRRKALCSAR